MSQPEVIEVERPQTPRDLEVKALQDQFSVTQGEAVADFLIIFRALVVSTQRAVELAGRVDVPPLMRHIADAALTRQFQQAFGDLAVAVGVIVRGTKEDDVKAFLDMIGDHATAFNAIFNKYEDDGVTPRAPSATVEGDDSANDGPDERSIILAS